MNPATLPPLNSAEYWLTLIYLSAILLTGLPLNITLVLTLYRSKYISRSRGSAFLLVTLCLVDIYMILVSVPVSLVAMVTQQHAFGATTGCLIVGFLDDSASFIGLWCISMTSLDRLVAVTRPILYRKFMNKARVAGCLGLVIVVSLATSAPLFVAARSENLCGDVETAEWRLFAVCYQVIRSMLPLVVTFVSYCGIFLAARNLRYREQARKKVLDELDTKKAVAAANQRGGRGGSNEDGDVEDESGIDMIESSNSQQSDEDIVQPMRPLSAASSIRRSMVLNNNIVTNDTDNYSTKTKSRSGNNLSLNNIDIGPEFRKSLKFSNTAVFLDTLNNTFFTSNLMEELNIRHEDYFSLSQSEEEEGEDEEEETYETVCTEDNTTSSTAAHDEGITKHPGTLNLTPVTRCHHGVAPRRNSHGTTSSLCCCCVRRSTRSLPERLQLKAAVLLAVVAIVIIGSHIPSIIAGISADVLSGPTAFLLHLHFIVYTVNPVLFGFLNKTLRSKAGEILCHLFSRSRPDPLPGRKGRSRRSSVQATLKRIGRRISQTPLLNNAAMKEQQPRGIGEQVESWKKSDISVLSRKSLIRDQMTLRYFETNL